MPLAAALQPYLAEALGENTAGILGVLSLHESRRADLDAVADDGQAPVARGTLGRTRSRTLHGWQRALLLPMEWTCAGGAVEPVRACSANGSTADGWTA